MTQAELLRADVPARKSLDINPEMLSLAREARGVTQAELALASGVSQGNISKYEGNVLRVSEEHLESIARALQFPMEFFLLDERKFGFGSSCTYHRRRQTMPVRDLNMVLARTNILRMRINILLRGAEVENVNEFPRLDLNDYDGEVEKIAAILRSTWRLPQGPVTNLVASMEQAGGIVYRCPFGTRKIDAISQLIPGLPPIFFVNSEIPGDRLRFTLAHELGHIIMHRVDSENSEEEADRFASEFLMPARDIGPDLSAVSLLKLTRLKPYWKVSIGALIRRARDLGKITDRQYRSLNEIMGRAGYRMSEPAPIAIEEPKLLSEIIRVHRVDHGYSANELSRLLLMDEEEMREAFGLEPRGLRMIG